MKRGHLHMIGNAHIDAVWLWPWQEGYTEARATFSSVLQRMVEFPEYTFTADSVAYLAGIEEHDPVLFDRIAARVRSGRFEIVGGWWVEPDCNIPSGETFVRHALYSQRFLAAHFGVIATVGCNVDPFGHNANLPQLLSKARMNGYAFLRPSANEKQLPDQTFWWESPDGSRVLAYRIPHEYCSPGGDMTGHVTKALQQLPVTEAPLMVFYGVGNHGGGPTIENITSIERLAGRDLFPDMFPSTMRAFFDEAAGRDDIPVLADELQPHAVGCYAAVSMIKQQMRRAEHLLMVGERWSTLAWLTTGRPRPTKVFEDAWRQVLFNTFHDTMAGTAIEPAYVDARDQLGEASSVAARWSNAALQSIATRVRIPAETDMVPVLVFNPHGFEVTRVVEFEFGYPAPLRGSVRVVDDCGADVPAQQVRAHARAAGRRRLAFRATVPPAGWTTFRMYPLDAADGADTTVFGTGRPRADDLGVLDNGLVRARIDVATGQLVSLLSPAGHELLDPEQSHLQVIDDDTDTWSHGVRSLWKQRGTFSLVGVDRTADGPVRQAVRVRWAYGSSRVIEEYLLDAGSDRLTVRTRVDWHESLTALKVCWRLAVKNAVTTHEIPYGHITRELNSHEVPSHAFVDVAGSLAGEGDGSRAGLSLLNDGKYSFAVRADGPDHDQRPELAMTAVRSPAYAWHDPTLLDPHELEVGGYSITDTGLQDFTYELLPHDGDFRDAGTVRSAWVLNEPLTALVDCCHQGDLSSTHSLGGVTGSGVVLSVIKAPEDAGGGLVIRAYEAHGRQESIRLLLPVLGTEVSLTFEPHQIRTLLVTSDGSTQELDLLEWDPAAPPPGVT